MTDDGKVFPDFWRCGNSTVRLSSGVHVMTMRLRDDDRTEVYMNDRLMMLTGGLLRCAFTTDDDGLPRGCRR